MIPLFFSSPSLLYNLLVIMKPSRLLPFFSTAAVAQKTLDLGTLKWTLSSPTYTNITVPCSVPGQVHLDLYREGVIPDPYFGLGDFELRWVTYGNWTYETALEWL